jgi:hypothetical protein
MEYWILISAFIPFIFLIVTLVPVFREVHAYDALSWYFRLALVYLLVCFGIWWVVIASGWIGNVGTPVEFASGVIESVMMYGLLTALYLFGVFGIFEASLTLHILQIICRSGTKGIHPNAILSSYNRTTIVKTRIDRMMHSGDLVIVGRQYRLQKSFSLLILREYALNILRFLYPHP